MVIGINEINKSPDVGSMFLSLGSLISLVGFVVACIFIRCPKCKTAWVWMAVSKQSPSKWLQWLLTLNHCPTCENGENR